MNDPSKSMNDIIRIYLADGSSKNVRIDNHTTVQRVVDVVLDGLGLDQFSVCHFALRLAEPPTIPGASKQSECFWLHPFLKMSQDIHEMYQTEMSAFLYFYDQLSDDYLNHISWKIEQDLAMELGALMLKKRFPNVTVSNVEKKLDFKIIEQEGGLIKYLPEAMMVNVKTRRAQTLSPQVHRRQISPTVLNSEYPSPPRVRIIEQKMISNSSTSGSEDYAKSMGEFFHRFKERGLGGTKFLPKC
uniref:FERM domain-containing protein n=1 Tax=Panagrolaimus sp. JU765 TaxID=591449 RepID=A0AC34QPI6_9BILA